MLSLKLGDAIEPNYFTLVSRRVMRALGLAQDSLPRRLLFSALFAAALAHPTDEPSDHERGQQERDDHAHADEHIGENDSGAALDGHDVRSRLASMPLYGQSSGSHRRFMRIKFV